MSSSASVPWNRIGLISYLADRMKGTSPQFGKTALVKVVYILQEHKGVPCDYQFSLYNHGPFSSQILSDLDYADFIGVVDVVYRESGYGGYVIEPGEEASVAQGRARAFLEQHREAISSVTDQFGRCSAKELELRATTLYVQKDASQRNAPLTLEQLARQVRLIKPQFSDREVLAAIGKLEDLQLLAVAS
ncbi:MAG: hypothetical protein HY331_13130 [Chloroflexi bacterium]|nr:hypothetical protein [Chloroflexota bacterium]